MITKRLYVPSLFFPLLLLLIGCVSTRNLDAIRAVQVPLEVTTEDRQDCEDQAVAAGERTFPSQTLRTAANIGLWPIPELIIASERDEAAMSTYRTCLREKGYTVLRAPSGKQSQDPNAPLSPWSLQQSSF